ncbi:hypothetical protein LCGC14_1350240 [marine sediment metagenome]|uniref:Uncharacterized protein n=1 Tax=marine sediment metagenome TaxID=412755 RepID=A0A0F9KB94_9ZZZZ
MNRAEFLSMMAAMGAVVVGAPPTADVAPVDPNGTIIVGPGKWWVEADTDGTLSACRVRRPGYCTVGYVVVE